MLKARISNQIDHLGLIFFSHFVSMKISEKREKLKVVEVVRIFGISKQIGTQRYNYVSRNLLLIDRFLFLHKLLCMYMEPTEG